VTLIPARDVGRREERSITLSTRERIPHRHVLELGARVRGKAARVLDGSPEPRRQLDLVNPPVDTSASRTRTLAAVVADERIQVPASDVATRDSRTRVVNVDSHGEDVADRAG